MDKIVIQFDCRGSAMVPVIHIADPKLRAYEANAITNVCETNSSNNFQSFQSQFKWHYHLFIWVFLQLSALPTPYGINITTATNALATVRRVLQGAPEDLGIGNYAGSTLVDADGNALVFTRTIEVSIQKIVWKRAQVLSAID